ncbi:MAG: flagella basal body P-ring formation protein FlgA [Acidobacteriota bacterium]
MLRSITLPVKAVALVSLIVLLSLSSTAVLAIDCTPVAGDRITGKELAAADATFASIPPTQDLGPAPLGNADRVFHAWEIVSLERKFAVEHSESVPALVCFRRVTQTLTPEQLQPVLRAALASGSLESALARVAGIGGDVHELRASVPPLEILDYSQNPLPLGELQFRPENLMPSGLWRGRLIYGEGRSAPVWVKVIPPIVAGTQTSAQARPISKSQSARPSLLTPEVERGKSVHVEVASGGIHLGFDAEAESSGHIGEAVVLRNPANGHRFRAIVKAVGRVEVRP